MSKRYGMIFNVVSTCAAVGFIGGLAMVLLPNTPAEFNAHLGFKIIWASLTVVAVFAMIIMSRGGLAAMLGDAAVPAKDSSTRR
jgi:hypothetical protein